MEKVRIFLQGGAIIEVDVEILLIRHSSGDTGTAVG